MSRARSGLTLGEMLVALAVLLVFAAITIPIFNRAKSKSLSDSDVSNLKRIYGAWSIYEESNLGPPPDLTVLRQDFGSDATFLSPKDPFASQAGPFPLEPALPSWKPRTDFRISYSYFMNFAAAGKLAQPKWEEARLDRRIGILASVWEGSAQGDGSPFGAQFSGKALRVNLDGSMIPASMDGGDLGKALFGRK